METKSHLSLVCHLLVWSATGSSYCSLKSEMVGTARFIKTAQKLREVQRKDRRQKEAGGGIGKNPPL